MKKILLIFMTAMFGMHDARAQQDGQFSQYIFNGIYINPAYAGYKEQLNLQGFYRNQWTGVKGSPKTMSLAVDAIANNGNVGLALQFTSDQLGAQSNLSVYANYAYRLRLRDDGSSRLALGIGLGILQLGIDGAKLNPNFPEPDLPLGMQNTIVPDARAGVYYSDNKFYAGFSVDNLLSRYFDVARYAFVPQPKPHYYLTGGVLIPLSEDILLKPSFLLKDDRAGPTSLDVNAFILFGERFWVGGAYRAGVKLYEKSHLQDNLSARNAAIVALEFFAGSNLKIGYAYDFSVGPLQGQSGGTHEISIGYYFKTKRVRVLSPRYF